MVQTNTHYPQQAQFQTLKPNIKKIFFKNLFSIAGSVALIIGILLVFNWLVGLDIFLVTFEAVGIDIDSYAILLYLILVIVMVSIFLLLGNYLVARNLRYEFHQNKIIVYTNAFLVFINSKEIPYQNIVKISYSYNGIFNKLFDYGTIILDISGMKEDKIQLEFIDNVEQTVQYIQNLMRGFMYTQQAQFTENYKIDNILNRY
jgi:hypothetical protein